MPFMQCPHGRNEGDESLLALQCPNCTPASLNATANLQDSSPPLIPPARSSMKKGPPLVNAPTLDFSNRRSLIEEAPELPGAAWMLQLPERLRFDLADTFARNGELLTNFLKRMVGIHADPEAHAQNTLFTRCQ